MCEDCSQVDSLVTEAHLLLQGAKSLIRAIRNRHNGPDGGNYLDMEADQLQESIVNLFGPAHRTPAVSRIEPIATPPRHSRRHQRVRQLVA